MTPREALMHPKLSFLDCVDEMSMELPEKERLRVLAGVETARRAIELGAPFWLCTCGAAGTGRYPWNARDSMEHHMRTTHESATGETAAAIAS